MDGQITMFSVFFHDDIKKMLLGFQLCSKMIIKILKVCHCVLMKVLYVPLVKERGPKSLEVTSLFTSRTTSVQYLSYFFIYFFHCCLVKADTMDRLRSQNNWTVVKHSIVLLQSECVAVS